MSAPNNPDPLVIPLNAALSAGLLELADAMGTTPEFALTVILAEKLSFNEHQEWLASSEAIAAARVRRGK